MYQKLLSYLAALGIALGGSQAAAIPAYLEEIPDDLLSDLVDDMDPDELADLDRVRLSEVLSQDTRSKVRKLAIQLLQDVKDPAVRPHTEELLKSLARDDSSSVRAEAVFALSSLMENMGPLECNSLVCNWATSESTDHRHAVASALSFLRQAQPGAQMCMEFALEHLAADHAWRVRAAVAKAALNRMDDNRDFYTAILLQLEQDQARSVRRIVKKGFRKA